MDFRLQGLNQLLYNHDDQLYAARDGDRKIHVYRRARRIESVKFNGIDLIYVRDCPHHIFSLTENWTPATNPREWGLEVVLARLKEIDLWNRKSFIEDLEKSQIKAKESKARDMNNKNEAFLYDFAGQFKKTFSDINTANMSKQRSRNANL